MLTNEHPTRQIQNIEYGFNSNIEAIIIRVDIITTPKVEILTILRNLELAVKYPFAKINDIRTDDKKAEILNKQIGNDILEIIEKQKTPTKVQSENSLKIVLLEGNFLNLNSFNPI